MLLLRGNKNNTLTACVGRVSDSVTRPTPSLRLCGFSQDDVAKASPQIQGYVVPQPIKS